MVNRIKLPVLILSLVAAASAVFAQAKPDYLDSTQSVLVALKYSTIDAGQYRNTVVPVIAKPTPEPVLQHAPASAPEPETVIFNEDLSRFFKDSGPATATASNRQEDPTISLEDAVVAAVEAQNSISLPRGPVEQAILSVLQPPSKVIYLVAPFDEYTVQRGDTLYQIAANQYNDRLLISRILDANFDAIYNPNIIFEGQVIRLPRQ